MATKGIGRLTQWLRASADGTNQDGDRFTMVPHGELVNQAGVIDQAIALVSETRALAAVQLKTSVTRFRSAFEAQASPQKTLELAWHVQQAWHKLRMIEDSLHTLSKERDALDPMIGGPSLLPPEPPTSTAAAA